MTRQFHTVFTYSLLTLFVALVCACSSMMPPLEPATRLERFTGTVLEMSPRNHPSRQTTNDFSLRISGDSAYVHLPYFGRVYQPVMDDDGLNFSLPCSNMTDYNDVRNSAHISTFSVRKGAISYNFRLTAYKNGRFDLNVKPSNAQDCSYSGSW